MSSAEGSERSESTHSLAGPCAVDSAATRPPITEQILTALKATAIVAGACWALFRYLAHERDANILALDQQRLSLRQAEVVGNFQKLSEEQRVRQLMLTNEQARLSLQTQKLGQELRIEEQRLGNEQSRLELAIQEGQRNLHQRELEASVLLRQQEVEAKRLESEKARYDLKYSTAQRFGREFTLSAQRLSATDRSGFADFEVSHGYAFENTSRADIEVSVVAIDFYIGVAKHVASGPRIASIGAPPDRWNAGSAQPGDVEWAKAGGMAAILGDAFVDIGKEMRVRLAGIPLVPGGPGTGLLTPERLLYYSDTYLVRAPEDAWVLFVTSYCFNRCRDSADMHSDIRWTALRKAEIVDAKQSAPEH